MPTDPTPPDDPKWGEAELLEAWEKNFPGQQEMARDLLARYGEPHRRYHNTEHLARVLQCVEEFAGPDPDLYVVRLAAWFHDAVYAVPEGQVTNEEASARLVMRELGRAGLEQEDLNEIARLVRVTATHHPGTKDPNGDLICDADLAILGAPPEDYRHYIEGIRAEYAHVDEVDFVVGRHDILSALADGPIYRTGRARKLLPQARTNLESELGNLERRYRELTGSELVPEEG